MKIKNESEDLTISKQKSWYMALKIAGIYGIFGFLWIKYSDLLVMSMTSNPEVMTQIQTYKGWLYVLVSASLIYWLILRKLLKIQSVQKILHSSNRALKVLSECNQSYVRRTTEKDLLQGTLKILAEKGGYCLAWIGFIEEDNTKSMILVAQVGCDKRLLTDLKLSLSDSAKELGPISKAIYLKHPVVVKDISTNSELNLTRTTALKLGCKSFVALPLISDNKVLGTLNIYSTEHDTFDTKEIQLLMKLAADMSYGIEARRIQEKHKIAEKTLKESEAQLRGMFENANVGIALNNPEGSFIKCNPKFESLIGYTIEELKSLTFKDITHPDDLEKSFSLYNDLIEGRSEELQLEKRYKCKNGKILWAKTTGNAVRDTNGKLIYTAVMVSDITEQKQADEALQKSEAQLRGMYENSGIGIALVEPDGSFIKCNPKFEVLMGYTIAELKSMTFKDFTHPDDTEISKSLYQDLMSGRIEQLQLEKRYKCKNGKILWAFTTGNVVRDTNGESIYSVIMVSDITERKQAEEELKRYDAILNAVNYAADRFLKSSSWEDCIDDILKCFGEATDASRVAIGKNIIDKDGFIVAELLGHWHTADLTDVIFSKNNKGSLLYEYDKLGLKRIKEMLRNGEIFSSNIKDLPENEQSSFIRNKAKSIIIVPIIIEQKWWGIIGFADTLHERTWNKAELDALRTAAELMGNAIQRLQIIKDLQASEEKFAKAFRGSPDGYVITSVKDYKILEVNEGFIQLSGYSSPEIIGKTTLELNLWADIKDRDVFRDILGKQGFVRNFETQIRIKSGGILTCLLSAEMIEINDEPFIVTITKDFTELKRLQDLESRAQRLESAGQFAGQIAHDFNNLMAPLLAYPDFIRDELPEHHPALTYLHDIENSAKQMAEINQELLTLGRRGQFAQEAINLNKTIQLTTKQLGHLPNTLLIETQLDEKLFNIKGGQSQLIRVIMNLITNARDAMDDNGKIILKSENYYADEITGKYNRVPVGEYVKLTIKDNGCGIPEDVISKIFDPFITTKKADTKRGSGLGLSVADAVVRDHGGYIDLQSTVGEGTSFYLYFPVTRDTVNEKVSQEIIGGTESILIVDDDDIQLKVSENILNKLGYSVDAVDSGEKAVEYINNKSVDLLILDMIMKPGIDGTETYRRILDINPKQKAIIVSGSTQSDRANEAINLGVGAFVGKPINTESFAQAVRNELDRTVKKVIS